MDEYDYEPPACFMCRGTGEGLADGASCGFCKGHGYIIPDNDREYDDYDDYDLLDLGFNKAVIVDLIL